MSSSNSFKALSLLMMIAFAIVQTTMAGDPDILTDFIAPIGVPINGSFFTFTGMRALIDKDPPPTFHALKASKAEFPALDGQSVSYAALQFPPKSVNPPHTHPRSAELLFVVQGSLQVGFVDTTDRLFTQTLQTADMFIFPKGLVHFQFNADAKNPALAISAFASASAGLVSLPITLFNTSIDDNVLALSFKTDVATIQTLKKGFRP
ncbi:hypothetical protein PIB30_018650 [Stylosanthes scabra]|uniref:Germin-like protein n=1 Tax=Stylosanthes scabra TaxID=79078 RepID=A0ABU6U6Y4_9FABA|nr:hypothetical protein [Stylosanthes scabra]